MAEKVIIEVEIDAEDAGKGLQKVEKSVEGIGKASKKTSKSVKGFGKSMGNLLKGAGIIGLISTAIAVLQEAFQNNQKVMDLFSNGTKALGIAFNDLFNFISENIDPVINYFKQLFDDPQQALKDFGTAIKENLIERFESFLDTLGFLASAVKELFAGNFTEAMNQAKLAGKEMVDVYTGVNNSVDRASEAISEGIDAVVDYTKETYAMAESITAAEKSLRLLELQQTRVREQSDRDAEQQRQLRDDVTLGIDERIAANERLAIILNKQQEDEQQTVKDRIAALHGQQAQLGFNQERLEQIFELETELIAIEAQQAGFRSEQLINENGLIQEKIDLQGFQTLAELEAYELKSEAEKKLADEVASNAKKKKKQDEKDAADEKKLAETVADAKIAAGSAILGAVEGLAKKGSKAAKAAAVGQATIDTYSSAVAAYKGMVGIPVVGQVLAPIAAAAAIAMGLNSVKQIAATDNGDGGGGSAGSISNPTPPSTSAPNFGISGDNDTNNFVAVNSQPVKAYITFDDLTDADQQNTDTENGSSI